MAICVGEEGRLFTLQTKHSSYQMLADDKNVLLHLYYGDKIGEGDELQDLIRRSDMGFSGNPVEAGRDRTYSLDTLPQEIAGFGTGDYRESSVMIEQADKSLAAEFRFAGYEILDGAKPVTGMPGLYDTEEEKGQTLVIIMKEAASQVEVRLNYCVFEEKDIIARWAEITNQGAEEIHIKRFLSMSMDMLYGDYDMIYFAGRHAYERELEREKVKRAKVEIGSVRGTSSHHYNPAFILCEENAGEDQGACYGFCFVYSGNFVASAQKDQRGSTRVQMGIHSAGFDFGLKAGESFCAPQVIMSYSGQGLTTLSRNFHTTIREHICRGHYKHEKRPVLINNWEATYFDFNEEKLTALAKQAAALGIEMLVLDDGWFGKRNDDNSGLGDWFVNEKKLGGTMKQVAEKINTMGMKFGLWFEPEMISEDSDLYRAHPDWVLQIPGREPVRSRNQLVLDMSREDVRTYLLERLTDILSNAPIAYVKWDMNRSICDVFDQSGQYPSCELYHRYILGLYDLLEKFHQRFPDVLLEGCSGGGGRFDAGMLYYSPQIWCSDNTDAINRLSIQYGTSFFYPVSSMGAHVSAVPNHQTGRLTSFKTRGNVALSGSFGYELDPNQISDEEKEEVKEQIRKFHHFYDLTHEGDYYRLTGLDKKAFFAWEFVAPDKSHAMVTLVKTDVQGNDLPVHTALKGLDPERRYLASIDGTPMAVRTGAGFMHAGITLPQMLKEYDSVIIELTEEQ